MKLKNKFLFRLFCLIYLFAPCIGQSQNMTGNLVNVTINDSLLRMDNSLVSIEVNLKKGTYSVSDLREKIIVFENARLGADNWNTPFIYGPTRIGKQKVDWEQKPVEYFGRKGQRVELFFTGGAKPIPEYRFAFTLLANEPSIIIQPGIKNTLTHDCRFMKAELFSNATLYPGSDIQSVQTLNGAAGVTMPEVLGDVDRESTNSMLLTALVNGKRRSVVWGGLHYEFYYANTIYNKENRFIHLLMNDPVGRTIKAGEEWWAPDTYYLGIGDSDPFPALEKYGLALREANNAHPNVYDFPTLCGWAVGNLSGGKDINNSSALVEQMDEANKCGLTKYTKVAVRLEPDSYCYDYNGDTEQGWWDDEHWSKFGHLVAPYETFAKWCNAVKERNGIPFTYFQSGMPSDDFARAHPEWMLYNDISKLHLYHRHHQPNVRYDYTDKNFQNHVLNMWKRLRADGMIGIKFDYPETAWNPGGFDDPLATTTSAYRTLFQLCRDGLGPEARIHERALGESDRPTLDVAAGIVDIQRTAWDNNLYEPQFVTTGGLRWYKSRSVFLYYPDSKAIHIHNAEIRQSLVTMMALTSGRLELATPFNMLTPEMVHDLSRIYPMYHGIKSPRPVDAFTGIKDPCIYDLELAPGWHTVALYNSAKEKKEIAVTLDKQMVDGGLAFNPNDEYYVYDFWKDAFIGKINGSATLKSDLNSQACALYSVKKVETIPQLLSTNRHILQGYMDVKDMKWDASQKSLSGKASVVEGEPFRITIATNGWKAIKVKAVGGKVKLENHPAGKNLKVIVIESKTSGELNWVVSFSK